MIQARHTSPPLKPHDRKPLKKRKLLRKKSRFLSSTTAHPVSRGLSITRLVRVGRKTLSTAGIAASCRHCSSTPVSRVTKRILYSRPCTGRSSACIAQSSCGYPQRDRAHYALTDVEWIQLSGSRYCPRDRVAYIRRNQGAGGGSRKFAHAD